MPLTPKSRRPASSTVIAAFRALLLLMVPFTAYAADTAAKAMDFTSLATWITLGAVMLLTLAGYAGSSLPQWAGWVQGDLTTRLQLAAGLITALLAGNFAYFLARHLDMPGIVCFMAATAGGWGGDKFLAPLLGRLTDLISAAIGERKNTPNP